MSNRTLTAAFYAAVVIYLLPFGWIYLAPHACPVPSALLQGEVKPPCFEFWFNRYQGLIAGLASAAIAGAAAILLLVQIRKMSDQNSVALEALQVAREQQIAAERRQLAVVLDRTLRVSRELALTNIALARQWDDLSELTSFVTGRMKATNSERRALRRDVLGSALTKAEKGYFALYDASHSKGAAFFAARIASTIHAEEGGKLYAGRAATREEAIDYLKLAEESLERLSKELGNRFGFYEWGRIPGKD